MYLRVKVVPKAKKEKIEKINGIGYIISVKEPARNNLANDRVKVILSKELKVSEKNIRLLLGHHSQHKMYSIKSGSLF